jgi:CheY-like chemotaxis protein
MMSVLLVSPEAQGAQIATLLEDACITFQMKTSIAAAVDALTDRDISLLVLFPQFNFDPWSLSNLIRSTDHELKSIPIVIVTDRAEWIYQRMMLGYYQATTLLEYKNLSALPGKLQALQAIRHKTFRQKILVVDDNPVAQEHISRFLKPLYDVDCVSSGAEALRVFAPKAYDLVMVDLRMPHMNGFTLMEKLLAVDPGIMLMGLSAEMDLESGVRLQKLGVSGVYSKSKMQSAPLIDAIHQMFVQRHFHYAQQMFQTAAG